MYDANSVVIVTKDGPTVITENKFDPAVNKLARGSRIPASVAVALGFTYDKVLNSIAGNPDDAPEVNVGLIPIAYNPPYPNLPQNFGGAPGSTNALGLAAELHAPVALLWDAAIANPDIPVADESEESQKGNVDTGQIFGAKVGPEEWAVVDKFGRILGEKRFGSLAEAAGAWQAGAAGANTDTATE